MSHKKQSGVCSMPLVGGDAPMPDIARLVAVESVILFPKGIPAFENVRRFVLQFSDKLKPFIYLKSLDVDGLGFICVNPFAIHPEYDVNLQVDVVSFLALKNPDDALLLSFVTVAPNPHDSTANIMGPIVINMANLVGCQVIFEQYPVRYQFWQAVESLCKPAEKGV